MREIKFRAWQTYHKRMLTIDTISFNDGVITSIRTYNGKGVVPEYTTYSGERGEVQFWLFEEGDSIIHIMQYTGLKDKNGVEIYEGDIVTVKTEKGIQAHSIEWVDFSNYVGYRMYGVNRRWNVPLTKNRVYNGCIQVIGNIYENPELLK